MLLYGITGGIGTGKSAVAEMLAIRAVPVADTDLIARQVVEPGQPALAEIRDRFGSEMIDVAGRVRRDRLAQLVFGDAEARGTLEAILHPRIRAVWREQAGRWRAAGMRGGDSLVVRNRGRSGTGSNDLFGLRHRHSRTAAVGARLEPDGDSATPRRAVAFGKEVGAGGLRGVDGREQGSHGGAGGSDFSPA